MSCLCFRSIVGWNLRDFCSILTLHCPNSSLRHRPWRAPSTIDDLAFSMSLAVCLLAYLFDVLAYIVAANSISFLFFPVLNAVLYTRTCTSNGFYRRLFCLVISQLPLALWFVKSLAVSCDGLRAYMSELLHERAWRRMNFLIENNEST